MCVCVIPLWSTKKKNKPLGSNVAAMFLLEANVSKHFHSLSSNSFYTYSTTNSTTTTTITLLLVNIYTPTLLYYQYMYKIHMFAFLKQLTSCISFHSRTSEFAADTFALLERIIPMRVCSQFFFPRVHIHSLLIYLRDMVCVCIHIIQHILIKSSHIIFLSLFFFINSSYLI